MRLQFGSDGTYKMKNKMAKYSICISEDLLREYPRAVRFLDSPARGKGNVICALLEQFFVVIGQDGKTKSKAQSEFYEDLIHSMGNGKNIMPERKDVMEREPALLYGKDSGRTPTGKRVRQSYSEETVANIPVAKAEKSDSVDDIPATVPATIKTDGTDNGGPVEMEDPFAGFDLGEFEPFGKS